MTNIRLTTINTLTDADWALWLDVQRQSKEYESPYFRPEFARAVAAVRDDVEVGVLMEKAQPTGFFPFQRGRLNLGKPVGGKLSDYHGPLLRPGSNLNPIELLQACGLASWDFDHLSCATEAFAPYSTALDSSPQLDLADGFEAYALRRRKAGSDVIHNQARKTRKLMREVGPIDFAFDAEDDEAYILLRAWKSVQYARTGLADVFAFPWTVELLDHLREHRGTDFSAPLSVLRAGGKVAAVCLSLRSRGVLHTWFNAYNPELSQYSPGVTLFVRLAEEAEQLGIQKIDLGRGDERYKRSLASGGVSLGEGSVTCPSVATWLRSRWRRARDWVHSSPLRQTAKIPARLIQPLRHWLAYH